MKIAAALTLALCAVLGIALAQDFNNFNNNDFFDNNDFDDDFGRFPIGPSSSISVGRPFTVGQSFSSGPSFGSGFVQPIPVPFPNPAADSGSSGILGSLCKYQKLSH